MTHDRDLRRLVARAVGPRWLMVLPLLGALVLLTMPLWAQSTVTTNPRITGEQGTTVTVGTGGATARVVGALDTQFTPVSNTSIGAEDVLYTYTLPANTLTANGQGVRVTAAGSFAANANAKSARIYFGATLIGTTGGSIGSPNGTAWRLTMDVLRASVTTQIASGVSVPSGGTPYILVPTPGETLSGAVVIKVVGFSATAATDVTARLWIVEVF